MSSDRTKSRDEQINWWRNRLVRKRKINEERSQWRTYQGAFCLLSNRLWRNGQNYTDARLLKTLGKFNNLCSVSMATCHELCSHCAPSGTLSKDPSLLYVMFTLRVRSTPKGKHMALYTLVRTPMKRAVKGNSTCFYSFFCVLSSGRAGTNDRLYGSML